ncbi:MAG: methionyl-tRNA formyltransferase [Proteobacteria bacterium]|nr:methionyl-tRNA formyltransferase [Pseudomonadota bacterium]
MTPLRLIFMGSPEFSVPALAALLDAGHDIAAVYSQPPRPAGRGHKKKPSAVHAFALEKGLPVHTPVSLKGEDEQAALAAFGADAAVVVAYGLLLPKAVLEAPKLGCFNVHASLLPRWRGAAPIERAIMAGDEETGISIMQMDAGLDTGPLVAIKKIPISPETTAETLHDALSGLGAGLMLDALEGAASGTLVPAPQAEDGVTYASKLQKAEGRLDWNRPAAELERQVRALNPRPGVWFEHDGERIKVLAAEITDQPAHGAEAGTVLDDAVSVACGDGAVSVACGDGAVSVACGEGALKLLRLQRAGKGAQEAVEFLRGFPLAGGSRLT